MDEPIFPRGGKLPGHFNVGAQPHYHKPTKYLHWFYRNQKPDFLIHKNIQEVKLCNRNSYDEPVN